ncbi:MAG: hypothetical protein ACJ71L_04465, partial [Nitrososphaeraceae archaeon]
MARDQHSNGSSNTAATAATTTAARNNNTRTQNLNSTDSNLKTLLDFKKSLLEEQKETDQRIQEINNKIESTKMQIDEERSQLEELRNKLKQINEQKDTEYTRFMELKKSLIEVRDEMKKTIDDKTGSSATSKSRKDRFDIANLSKNLEQIEHDIQTKKLSKDEERKLVARSKEIATKLHGLKIIHKKEERYRRISSQYEALKTKMNSIFDQKTEFGSKIGTLKSSLDSLLNLREELYEERRKEIHGIREIAAKLEMVETQLNAIEF